MNDELLMYMIRHNRSMEYVALIDGGDVMTTRDGLDAMHFVSERNAVRQCDILREFGESYTVVVSQTTAVR